MNIQAWILLILFALAAVIAVFKALAAHWFIASLIVGAVTYVALGQREQIKQQIKQQREKEDREEEEFKRQNEALQQIQKLKEELDHQQKRQRQEEIRRQQEEEIRKQQEQEQRRREESELQQRLQIGMIKVTFRNYYNSINNRRYEDAYSELTDNCKKRLGSVEHFEQAHKNNRRIFRVKHCN